MPLVQSTNYTAASDSDKYFQEQISATEKWGAEQKKNQQAQTDFAIEKIEQQKDQTQKDYTKEQSGAYVDWQKQSNQYGAEAEKMASSGLQNTGYSESSQVSMYNTYQNRVATAREVFSQAVLAYDNNIKEARLQNNAVLAEIGAADIRSVVAYNKCDLLDDYVQAQDFNSYIKISAKTGEGLDAVCDWIFSELKALRS